MSMSESASGEATGSSTDCDKELSSPRYKDADWLEGKYWGEHLTTREIAAECGCCKQTVVNWLERHDIEIRSDHVGKGQITSAADEKLSDESWMRETYWEDGNSLLDIAKLRDTTEGAVLYWMKRHEIARRYPGDERPSGEDHYKWSGGYADYYGSTWPRQRAKALERDGEQCQYCGSGERLEVHHIIPIRKYDDPDRANKLLNLVTFCIPCHNKWEGICLRPDPR